MDQVIQSEKKLHILGFVQFVDNLNIKDRDMIHESQVKYFIPWRAVWNENSLSTHVDWSLMPHRQQRMAAA